MGFRYLACDLRTDELLAELPLRDVSFSDDLSNPGDCSGVLDLYAAGAATATFQAATTPGRTALYIDLDGQLVWGGIIWRRRKASDGTAQISANGFLSFYGKFHVLTDQYFADVEQLAIARALAAAVAVTPGGGIGIDVSSPAASGVTRTQQYAAADRTQVLQALQDLAALQDGFDLAVTASYGAGGARVKTLTLGYPALGRTEQSTDLVVDYPGAIAAYEWTEEGDRIANVVFVRGVGSASTTADAVRENPLAVLDGYPRLEGEFSAPALRATDTLEAYADALLAAYSRPVALPVLTLQPAAPGDPAALPLSAYGPGDWFRVVLADPAWFPATATGSPGYDAKMRCLSRSVTVDNDGTYTVALTMRPAVAGLVYTAPHEPTGPVVPILTPDGAADAGGAGTPGVSGSG